jgi:hypothetical protein
MIDFFAHVMAVIRQIFEAPQILALLILWFFVARFIGKLTVRLSWWKVVLALFVFPLLWPDLWSLSPILIVIFIAGILSNHTETIRAILAWSEGIGDLVYAIRYRQAFADIERREEELRAREQAFRNAERTRSSTFGSESTAQQRWRKDAKQERAQKAAPGAGGAGRGGEEGRSRSDARLNTDEPPKRDPLRDQYLQTLGLSPRKTYTQTEIKAAYRRAVKKAHPDTGGSESAIREVMAAYAWLQRNNPRQ